MGPPLPSCGGLIPSEPQDCLGEGRKMLSEKPRTCSERKPSKEKKPRVLVQQRAGRRSLPGSL